MRSRKWTSLVVLLVLLGAAGGLRWWWLQVAPRTEAVAVTVDPPSSEPGETERAGAEEPTGIVDGHEFLKLYGGKRTDTDRRAAAERDNTGYGATADDPASGDADGERGGVVPGADDAPVGELQWDEANAPGGDTCTLVIAVTDQDGAPRAGTLVHLRREERWDTQHYALVKTRDNGTAQVSGVPISYYRASIEEDGALPHSRSWRCDGGHDGQLALTLRSGDARLFGRVLEEGTDQPLHGAAVSVQEITRDRDAKDFKTPTFVTVNEDGGFDFAVRGGKSWQYRLYARAPGYEFTNVDVFLDPGESRRVTFHLKPFARVEGVVVTSTGEPAASAHVAQGGNGALVGVDTDDEGRFSMEVRDGRRLQLVVHTGTEYATRFLDPLAPGETRGGIRIQTRPGRTVRGVVQTADGQPIPFARVFASVAVGGILRAVHANASGEIVYEGLPRGGCTLMVTGSLARTEVPPCESEELSECPDVEVVVLFEPRT